jgi:hypothetical protein
MLYYISISILVVLFIAFAIHFVNFQKTRCFYSESGSDNHEWDLWVQDWDQMVQWRQCKVCKVVEVRRIDGKRK